VYFILSWNIKKIIIKIKDFSMNKIQSGVFLASLAYLQTANAIFIPEGSVVLAENSFAGQITDVVLDPAGVAGGWITLGDVSVGSKFTADFALYEDTLTEPGEISFGTEFTFYGINDNYTFELEGGWSSSWGTITVNADNSLLFGFHNNFYSDGLESTFNGNIGDDAGGFFLAIDDYTSANITGSGSLGEWAGGIRVDFDIASASAPTPISAPTVLWLLGSGLVSLIGFTRRKK
jgi:hypothetical protein